jgi:hypothetical protein
MGGVIRRKTFVAPLLHALRAKAMPDDGQLEAAE